MALPAEFVKYMEDAKLAYDCAIDSWQRGDSVSKCRGMLMLTRISLYQALTALKTAQPGPTQPS